MPAEGVVIRRHVAHLAAHASDTFYCCYRQKKDLLDTT